MENLYKEMFDEVIAEFEDEMRDPEFKAKAYDVLEKLKECKSYDEALDLLEKIKSDDQASE